MLTLYIENGILYVEQMKDLKYPIVINGVEYNAEEDVQFEDVEVVRALLMRNARVLIKKGNVLVRPNLYDFEMALAEKDYELIDGLPKVEKVVEGAKFEVVEPVDKPVAIEVTKEDIEEAEAELEKEIEALEKEEDEKKDYNNKKKNRNKNRQESDK